MVFFFFFFVLRGSLAVAKWTGSTCSRRLQGVSGDERTHHGGRVRVYANVHAAPERRYVLEECKPESRVCLGRLLDSPPPFWLSF